MVTYEVKPGGPIVFSVDIDGYGRVPITSRRPGFFCGRVTNRAVLQAALRDAERFADEHETELAVHYANIAQPTAA